jgi:hypothetical protein
MVGTTGARVERRAKRRILVTPMRQADVGRTRVFSQRQLPTDHDYAGGPLARSANIRVINRRCLPPRLPLQSPPRR